jgi:hypothetical protein
MSDAALRDRADGVGAPWGTFTEPQVAAVGLTAQTARDAGIDVQIVSVGTSADAGAPCGALRDNSGCHRRLLRTDTSGNALSRTLAPFETLTRSGSSPPAATSSRDAFRGVSVNVRRGVATRRPRS